MPPTQWSSDTTNSTNWTSGSQNSTNWSGDTTNSTDYGVPIDTAPGVDILLAEDGTYLLYEDDTNIYSE